MATPVKLYQKEMHDNTGFFATWLPGDAVEIGDAGRFEGGRFRRMSSLKELGIEFTVSCGQSVQNVDYSSTRGTKISTAAGAEVVAVGKAEISIDFSEQGAFVFQASQLQLWQLENRMIIGEQVVKAYEQNRWDKSWLLIESLHSAERATVIVSEDSAAGLVLVAKLNQVVPSISLVDPRVSLSVASSRGKMVRLIGNKDLHPLYSCLRLKTPLFGSASLRPVRGTNDAQSESQFSKPGISELLDS